MRQILALCEKMRFFMYYAFSTSTEQEFQCEYMTDVFCITHVHGYFELIFVVEGEINIQTENADISVNSGNMAIMMPYEVHGFKTLNSSKILVMEFPVEYIAEYRKLFDGRTFENPVVNMSESLKSLVYELIMEQSKDVFDKKSIIYRAISEFMKKTELTESGAIPGDIFRRAVMYISENFSEDISQQSVADAIGVSAVHLSRVLSRQQNFGFIEIVNSARIKEAKKLMEETDMSVADVAFAVGFGSIRNFNRICKKYFNCTPTDLRKSEKVEFMTKKEATQF